MPCHLAMPPSHSARTHRPARKRLLAYQNRTEWATSRAYKFFSTSAPYVQRLPLRHGHPRAIGGCNARDERDEEHCQERTE
jgi:hypothetical protein